MKTALITGITGQDGSYLAPYLLERDYKVYGTYKNATAANLWRIRELGFENHPNLHLEGVDITDLNATTALIERIRPQEIYNFAAQSFVGLSFEQPALTAKITGLGAINLLESIRLIDPSIRFYQASTSEMYGNVQMSPQTENTPFYPRSPYSITKHYAHCMTINYREIYGIFGAIGILFNHESPLRGLEFVTRKITDAIAKLRLGKLDKLELGNLDAKRDWGYAKEYVAGMWRMLQVEHPDTYVLATGRAQTVRDFVTLAARAVDFDLTWEGFGEKEIAIDRVTGKTLVVVNPKFYRPVEVNALIGDASKARIQLDWTPHTCLEKLCQMMVDEDMRRNKA